LSFLGPKKGHAGEAGKVGKAGNAVEAGDSRRWLGPIVVARPPLND